MPASAVMHQLRPRPDDYRAATMADLRGLYRRNFRRLVILGAFFLILAGCFSAYTVQQDNAQRATTKRLCEQRRAGVTQANAFYQAMAVLEESNRFIDQELRDKRVALYRGLVYPLPSC